MKNIIAVVCLVMAFSSCYNDKADKLYPSTGGPVTCDTTNVTYSGTIAPIIAQNCSVAGCHDATTKQNNYDMSKYADLVTATQSDLFLGDINFVSGYIGMPYNGTKMSSCDIAKIEIWIRNGTPNN